ncbi:MAG TPA: methyltransferase domain-containing protein [Armatimonadota bacterium]|nr:methyltransferase domain-containing protein [Armatimonadota bacterium]
MKPDAQAPAGGRDGAAQLRARVAALEREVARREEFIQRVITSRPYRVWRALKRACGRGHQGLRCPPVEAPAPRPVAPPPAAAPAPVGSPRRTPSRGELGLRLSGVGVDISPLHSPVATDPQRSRVYYVDRLEAEQIRRHYPNMVERGLVMPDVVCDGGAGLAFGDSTLNFIIASHLLEHVHDPIGALRAWHRALRPGGHLLMVVPDPGRCADRSRLVTPIDHLIADHEAPSAERDLEHFREWAQFWDKCADGLAIEARARKLVEMGYAIHYHDWSAATLAQAMQCVQERYGCHWRGLVIPDVASAEGFVGLWEKLGSASG